MYCFVVNSAGGGVRGEVSFGEGGEKEVVPNQQLTVPTNGHQTVAVGEEADISDERLMTCNIMT